MKTILDLQGVEFLKVCNKLRHSAEKFLKGTKFLDVWKRQPILTGEETEEELKAKKEAQQKKNVDDVLDILLDSKAEETYSFLRLLIQTEDGEDEPTGADLMSVAFRCLSDPKFINFLSSWANMGQMAG